MLETMMPAAKGGAGLGKQTSLLNRDEKKKDVRHQNIVAARAVADAVRTSLGPRGMDKMIREAKGSTLVTNDGATIMKEMSVVHPTARMLVELSRAQDVEAGDGTTSVVILAGGLLRAAEELLDKNIHPQLIVAGFQKAAREAQRILAAMAQPVALDDREAAIKTARVALASKVVSDSAPLLAPIAVDACMRLRAGQAGNYLDLKNIRIVKMLGGTVDETALVPGLVFTNRKLSRRAMPASGGVETLAQSENLTGGAPPAAQPEPPPAGPGAPAAASPQSGTVETRGRSSLVHIKDAKVALAQFCLSPPKTDMDNSVAITSYQQMDRLLKSEKLHVARQVQTIAATGCNVLILQKSILRDAVTDLSLDYLAKARIVVIRDIERDDMDYLAHQFCCDPIASIDLFTKERLGQAKLVVEEDVGGGARVIKITGLKAPHVSTIFLRASNEQLLDEAERSLHDALCVVRCLFKQPWFLPGGGASEIELAHRVHQWSRTLQKNDQRIAQAYAEALTVIPYSLAENGSLPPLETIAALKAEHAQGRTVVGIDARKGQLADMVALGVIQPLLVTASAVALATETVNMILRIDDIVMCR